MPKLRYRRDWEIDLAGSQTPTPARLRTCLTMPSGSRSAVQPRQNWAREEVGYSADQDPALESGRTHQPAVRSGQPLVPKGPWGQACIPQPQSVLCADT